jgi:hypothetical protein
MSTALLFLATIFSPYNLPKHMTMLLFEVIYAATPTVERLTCKIGLLLLQLRFTQVTLAILLSLSNDWFFLVS